MQYAKPAEKFSTSLRMTRMIGQNSTLSARVATYNATALAVQVDLVEVIGQGTVRIHDGSRRGGAKSLVLRSRDRCDLVGGR